MSFYTVIILTGGSLADSTSDNNIIRIMSDQSVLSALSPPSMLSPHTGVRGLFDVVARPGALLFAAQSM